MLYCQSEGIESKEKGEVETMRTKRGFQLYTGMWLLAVLLLVVMLLWNVGDARIINYSGLVRGATQRLVKEEMNGKPDDGLIVRLDGIIYDLQTGRGDYNLAKNNDRVFQKQLSELNQIWKEIKDEISAVRSGNTSNERLYDLSQEHFELADQLVLQAEKNSNHKLISFISVYFVILLLSIVVFVIVNNRNQKKLKTAAFTDKLTGLQNRAGFEAAASNLLRQQSKRKFVIVAFDIDNFKIINDSVGYIQGDELLRALASTLKSWKDENYQCARLDADDFILMAEAKDSLIPELQDILEHTTKAQGFLEPFGDVGFTYGVYQIQNNTELIKTIMDKAKMAHKAAKAAANQSLVWYDEHLLEKLTQERRLKELLQHALVNQEFELYLQPRVELSERRIVGAEALVRWELPGQGTLYPDSFIPLFEENGSIANLDFYMLKKVCSYLHERRELGRELFPVSVNFSRVTLYQQTFYETFHSIVDQYKIPYDCIEIEVTESAFNDIADSVLEMLNKLDEEGFPIAMDDFGSGYSNMNLLGSLPLQIIKLDKVFLQETDIHDRVKGIIICAVELAHTMGVQIVCEGAESEQHVSFLQEIGCDFAQGYYFAKPIPQKAFDQKYPVFEKRIPLPPRHMTRSGISMVPNWEKRSKRMFEEVLAETYPGFLSLRNEQHQIVYLNQNFRDWIAKYTDVDPLGKTNIDLAAIVPENVADTFMQCHDGSLDLQKDETNLTGVKKLLEFKGAAGTNEPSQYFDALKYWVVLDGAKYIFTVAYDVTELYQEDMFNLQNALTDSLTGAQNRRYLETHFEQFHGHYAAIFDLDHFKAVNDLEGHIMGDKILRDFVNFIREQISGVMAMIRLGGDEFLAIFQSGETADDILESLKQARSRYEAARAQHSSLSFSMGVSLLGEQMDAALDELDKLMYEDKHRNHT